MSIRGDWVVYKADELFIEGVSVRELVGRFGAPLYVYSLGGVRRRFLDFENACNFRHITCFSVKANSNIHILKFLGGLGAGADVVSGGELFRALKAGIAPSKIVFSGVGKTEDEIKFAEESGILMINVESEGELEAVSKRNIGVAIRIKFRGVSAGGHGYLEVGKEMTKFGVTEERALELYMKAKRLGVKIIGIHFHIGSQILDVEVFKEVSKSAATFIKELERKDVEIKFVDVGGGLGISYGKEREPKFKEYVNAIMCELRNYEIIFEPGRCIVGPCGVLMGRVIYIKESAGKKFVITDVGMNDLIRPAMYGAEQEVIPAVRKDGAELVDVVGPVCENSDFIARDVRLKVKEGDIICVLDTGAYGFSMSSQYNSRPRAAEVAVSGSSFRLIRKRETYEDLIRDEIL